jgi:hypothetical protein
MKNTSCALWAIAIAVGLTSATSAPAVTLFTTQEDFTGWSGGGLSLAPSATDLDGNLTNGLGNTTNAGGAGTGGSLSVTWNSGAYETIDSYGEQANAAFLAALGDGTGKQIVVDYTVPPPGTGNYFELRLHFNYDGNWTQVSPVTSVNNGPYWTNTYNYTVTGAISYFQFGFIYNSNYNTNTPFTIDNIQVVPEPAAILVAGVGGLGLILTARRFRRRLSAS